MQTESHKLLLIDDDIELAAMLQEFLELQGFEVATAQSGEIGLQQLEEQQPDLVVLDVMLPGLSGFETLQTIRERHDVPVIMLTARGEEPERILGLMRGADDYLAKPCSPLELALRIRTILKRVRPSPVDADEAVLLSIGPVRLDTRRREAFAGSTLLPLTAAEMRVLEQLMRHSGEVLSRARLTQLALERPLEAYDRSIDTLISKLRGKLKAAGVTDDCISGVRGQGYVMDKRS
ncbi:MAG: response regulator transcription factor [Steroidobacteraceae bacterium]